MLSILTLCVLSHLAPQTPPPDPLDPPVYGPCPAHNPNTEYHLWVSTAWDPTCYNRYVGSFVVAKQNYWIAIGQCGPGDCECYAAAWAVFLATMEAAENELRHCSLT